MSIFDRGSLEASPLADLHAIASELAIDSFRRLRKAELIEKILERQGGEPGAPESGEEEPAREEELDADRPAEVLSDEPPSPEREDPGSASSRRRRGGRGGRGRAGAEAAPEPDAAEQTVEGVVEVLPGGSGFVRINPPEPSDDDVYISAAQVRRCELVSGDRVIGPRRPPRRSERFASLIRVETVNGQPASERADAVRFEDLPSEFARERLPLVGEDASLAAVLAAAPLGRGSRAVIAGAPQSGKSELLRRLAAGLAGQEDVPVWLVLAGVRPEEISEWRSGPVEPTAAVAFGASLDAQSQAVDGAVEQARRLVARGAHGVLLVDSLSGVHESTARKALGSARSIPGGGSLTVIATAERPLGGETTVVALDPARARAGEFPALDTAASWTMRAEALEL